MTRQSTLPGYRRRPRPIIWRTRPMLFVGQREKTTQSTFGMSAPSVRIRQLTSIGNSPALNAFSRAVRSVDGVSLVTGFASMRYLVRNFSVMSETCLVLAQKIMVDFRSWACSNQQRTVYSLRSSLLRCEKSMSFGMILTGHSQPCLTKSAYVLPLR